MKRLFALVLLIGACSKKEEAPAPAEKSAAAPSASASTVESKKAASTEASGVYASKKAEVRTPDDAPPFIHPDAKEGIGDGTLTVTLPSGDGPATGKASGALGSQTFSGFVDGDRLTGTLTPEAGANPALWGVVDAKIDKENVTGTLRASNSDGRVVREATFTLKKK